MCSPWLRRMTKRKACGLELFLDGTMEQEGPFVRPSRKLTQATRSCARHRTVSRRQVSRVLRMPAWQEASAGFPRSVRPVAEADQASSFTRYSAKGEGREPGERPISLDRSGSRCHVGRWARASDGRSKPEAGAFGEESHGADTFLLSIPKRHGSPAGGLLQAFTPGLSVDNLVNGS
jgi:hypothetical protein